MSVTRVSPYSMCMRVLHGKAKMGKDELNLADFKGYKMPLRSIGRPELRAGPVMHVDVVACSPPLQMPCGWAKDAEYVPLLDQLRI